MKISKRILGLILLSVFSLLLVACNYTNETNLDDNLVKEVYYNDKNQLTVKFDSGREENLGTIDVISNIKIMSGKLIVDFANGDSVSLGKFIGDIDLNNLLNGNLAEKEYINNRSFIEGEKIFSIYGESYEIYIRGRRNPKEEKAIITSHVITSIKELDINNIEDYQENSEYFLRYLYLVEIEGKVPENYSEKSIYVLGSIPGDGVNRSWTGNMDDKTTKVYADGTFRIQYYQYINTLIKEFTPIGVSVS